jgi:hypothetical protein
LDKAMRHFFAFIFPKENAGERRRRKPSGFQVLRDKVAGQMDRILRTPKRLRPAASNRSTGGTTPLFALLLASLCRFSRHFDHIYESTT